MGKMNNKKNPKEQGTGTNNNKYPTQNNESKADRPVRGKFNDWNWYALNESIGKSVGNVPFNVFPGTEEHITTLPDGYTDADLHATPGVMCIKYAQMPGTSVAANSAINVAARAMYSFVRHQNSGHANYESADLMVYILAMSEIYTSFLEAKRIYGLAKLYTYTNRNVPNLVLHALGVDVDNITKNLAQFRAELNLFAAKVSALAVPNIYHAFKRGALIASTVLTDSTSQMSQFYIYKKGVYRVFDPTAATGGQLVAHAVPASLTYSSIMTMLNEMLDAVLPDEDSNIMSGDIIKAFGKENLYKLAEIDDGYMASFIYDENMLSQIENSQCFTVAAPTASELNITQKNNNIYNNTIILSSTDKTDEGLGYAMLKGNTYFNSHKDEPTWQDVLEYSRLMVGSSDIDSTSCYVISGSELIMQYEMYCYKYTSGVSSIKTFTFSSIPVYTDEIDNIQAVLLLSLFDWHPILYPSVINTASGTANFLGKYGDLKKYTLVSSDTRARINEAAVTSEFGAQIQS